MSVFFTWDANDFDNLVKSCEHDVSASYIFKYIPKAGKVVEAGCGLRRYVEFLSKKGFDIVGIEINPETVDAVRRIAPSLDIRVGNVLELPFEDNSISGVISLGVVEHFIEGPQKPLKEIFRVLKPGHYAVITVPSFNYIRRVKYALGIYHINPLVLLRPSNLFRHFFRKKPIPKQAYICVPYKYKSKASSETFFEYRFTKQEFETELRKVNFAIIESVPIALMDGICHDFGRAFVSFHNWAFYPNILGKFLNWAFGKIPFFHNHMHLCVVRK